MTSTQISCATQLMSLLIPHGVLKQAEIPQPSLTCPDMNLRRPLNRPLTGDPASPKSMIATHGCR